MRMSSTSKKRGIGWFGDFFVRTCLLSVTSTFQCSLKHAVPRLIVDTAGAVGGAAELGIVEHDQGVVGGNVNICLLASCAPSLGATLVCVWH